MGEFALSPIGPPCSLCGSRGEGPAIGFEADCAGFAIGDEAEAEFFELQEEGATLPAIDAFSLFRGELAAQFTPGDGGRGFDSDAMDGAQESVGFSG